MSTTSTTDVVVIGAGIAGATAAYVMANRGVRVSLIDPRPACPPCFKAEKIEPHQAILFRKFGLMDALLPSTGSIRQILDAKNGRIFKIIPIEQYGIYYHDLVNAVRKECEPLVDVRLGRVTALQTSTDTQKVILADGSTITARLIVDACGTSASLLTDLGLERETIEREQSVAFGFTIGRTDGAEFPFDSVTYYPRAGATQVAYLTLFRIGSSMRANLFVFWPPRDDRTRRLQKDMQTSLLELFPRLEEVTGPITIASKVEVGLIDLYRMRDAARPGLVLIGDAFQSVCPTTATGLSKSLTDVDVLCYQCLPEWLTTPGMGLDKIRGFYDDPRKIAVDAHSLGGGMYQRAMAVNTSLLWAGRRLRKAMYMAVSELKYRLLSRSRPVRA